MNEHGEAATAVLKMSQWPTVRDFGEFVADKGLQEIFNLKLSEPPRSLKSSEPPRRNLKSSEPPKSLSLLKPPKTSLPRLILEEAWLSEEAWPACCAVCSEKLWQERAPVA